MYTFFLIISEMLPALHIDLKGADMVKKIPLTIFEVMFAIFFF